jgi:serine/threonine protein phosphatase 1
MALVDFRSDVPLREEGRSLGRLLASRLFKPKKAPASIPKGGRVYAVGDIHGRLDLLKQLWEMIEADAADAPLHKVVVFIGDYVDRGPDSKGVIEFLINARLKGGVVLCLRGNHDQAVLDFMADANFYRNWKTFGAPETLMSYGVRPPLFDKEEELERARKELVQKCPEKHVKFLISLPYSHEIGGYFFAHAGARPGVPMDDQDPQDLLWIREDFLSSRHGFDKVVVHGHTPEEKPRRRAYRIGIDSGAYATGHLTALVLEGTEHRFLST